MEELYKKTESVMKGETTYFETTSGVRQGGPESPNLFNIFLDCIMRIYDERAGELGLGISFKFRVKDQARERKDPVPYRGSVNSAWLGYASAVAAPPPPPPPPLFHSEKKYKKVQLFL